MIVDKIFDLWEYPELLEQYGIQDPTDEDYEYIKHLAIRVARNFNVRDHIHLP
jgi:hypothetical protein